MKFTDLYRLLQCKIAAKQQAFEEQLERKRIERQTKNDQIPYPLCKNCGTELQGVYCHKCGQYARDFKQSFGSYVMEYLSNTYNLDGRIFQTIWLLFRKPGFLTNEFLQGKIKSYVHPLKLNIFLLFVVMTVFAFSITGHKSNTQTESNKIYNEMAAPDLIIQQLKSLDGNISELTLHNKTIELIAPFHTIKNNPEFFEIISITSAADNINPDTLTVATSQWLIDEKVLIQSGDKYYTFTAANSIFNDKSKEGQLVREKFLSFYQSYLPIFIILMSPILALILWGLNIRRKYGFLTHFIFSLHYSAFLEFVIFLLLVMTTIFPSALVFWCTIFAIVYMTTYLVIAFQAVYSHTVWYNATWKAICINTLYTVLVLAASLTLMIIFIHLEK